MFDVSVLDLSDALKLQEAVKEQIKASVEGQKETIRTLVTELSGVTGIPVQLLLTQLFPVPVAPPKYRDPANPQNVWSGRGKKPAWLQTALNEGVPLESFAV